MVDRRTHQGAEAGADPGIRRRTAHSLPAPPLEASGQVQRAKDAAVNHGIVPLEIDPSYARKRDLDDRLGGAGRLRVFNLQSDLIAPELDQRPRSSAESPLSAIVSRSPRASGAVRLGDGASWARAAVVKRTVSAAANDIVESLIDPSVAIVGMRTLESREVDVKKR